MNFHMVIAKLSYQTRIGSLGNQSTLTKLNWQSLTLNYAVFEILNDKDHVSPSITGHCIEL